MSSQPRGRELVFCHACSNEWYREQHGLKCPACDGTFTEIIEENNDPRRDNSPRSPSPYSPSHPLHDHNPWANAPDPDEDDIDDAAGPHSPGHFGSRRSRNRSPAAADGPDPSTISPLYQAISSIFNGIGGNATQPNMSQQRMPRFDADDDPERPSGGSRQTAGPAPGQPHVHIYSNSGPGFSFTARSSAFQFGRNEDHGRPVPMADLSTLMNNIFQSMHQTRGAGGLHHPHEAPNFATLLADAMMPGGAGNYLHSQEELDQFLADNHARFAHLNTSQAPPPATEEAIAALPRVNATPEILGLDPAKSRNDPDAEVDCSICTTGRKVGETVVVLPCAHWFCEECIVSWLGEHDTCPICRVGIVAKTEEDQDDVGNGANGHAAGGQGAPGSSSSASASRAGGLRRAEQPSAHDHRPQSVAMRQAQAQAQHAHAQQQSHHQQQHPESSRSIQVPESPTAARRSGRYSAGGAGGGGGYGGGGGSGSSGSSPSGSGGLGDRFRNWIHGSDSGGGGGGAGGRRG